MQWLTIFQDWFASAEGQRVFASTVVPSVAIVIAGVTGALIGRGATRRVIALTVTHTRIAAVAALIGAARRAAQWNTLSGPEQQHAEHVTSEADVHLRLLPVAGALMAADWASHEIRTMKRNSVTFGVQDERSLEEFRDRMVLWQAKPRRAKRLFGEDIDAWSADATATRKDGSQQSGWAASQPSGTTSDGGRSRTAEDMRTRSVIPPAGPPQKSRRARRSAETESHGDAFAPAVTGTAASVPQRASASTPGSTAAAAVAPIGMHEAAVAPASALQANVPQAGLSPADGMASTEVAPPVQTRHPEAPSPRVSSSPPAGLTRRDASTRVTVAGAVPPTAPAAPLGALPPIPLEPETGGSPATPSPRAVSAPPRSSSFPPEFRFVDPPAARSRFRFTDSESDFDPDYDPDAASAEETVRANTAAPTTSTRPIPLPTAPPY